MGRDETITRRRLLQTVPVAGSVAVAGCAEETDGDTGNGEESDGNETESEQTETESETETTEPTPDPPNVEKQIIQRDKAAITNVQRTVEGTVTWPSARFVDPVDSELLGYWEGGDYAAGFTDQREFILEGPDGSVSGTYGRIDDVLRFTYESGETEEWQYAVRTNASPWILDLYSEGDHVFRFQLVEQGTDDREPVRVANDRFVVPERNSTTKRETYRSGATGSGFIVSPDGYLVTNAHVVGTHRKTTNEVARKFAREQRSTIQQNLANDASLSDTERDQIRDALMSEILGYHQEYGDIEGVSEDVSVLNGRATPDDDLEVESWSATVETEGTVYREINGSPTMGRDVAVLSVDEENLPTVTLASANDVETGENLYVIGYPDIGIDEFFEDRETVLEPTMTSGIVSSRRTLDTGIDSIQTDAAINSGNSGGPMYNSDGEVVGVATFSPPHVDIQGVQFGLPIDIATGFLDTLGIENTTGEMQAAYEEGLEAYWRGDCETATAKMETVLDYYPDHPQASEFIADCENGDAPGQES